jgi:hypothetical protein
MFVLCGEEFVPRQGEIGAERAFIGQIPVIAPRQWPLRHTRRETGQTLDLPSPRADAASLSSAFLMPMA